MMIFVDKCHTSRPDVTTELLRMKGKSSRIHPSSHFLRLDSVGDCRHISSGAVQPPPLDQQIVWPSATASCWETNLGSFFLSEPVAFSVGFFVCLGQRCRPLLPGFDDRAMTCPWIPVTSYGLYTHAFWQLQELSKLTNLFEDRQSTPERTLRWLP